MVLLLDHPHPRADCCSFGCLQDRYAHRDLMTDVVIQHLVTEQRVRIKCRDYVKRISVYNSRIAVQLPDRIIVYEAAPSQDGGTMQYKSLARINKRLECSLLVVTSQHITLCLEKKLQCINFEGVKCAALSHFAACMPGVSVERHALP